MAKEPPPRFYTTDVPADRTVGEIMGLLAEHGSEHQQIVRRHGRPVALYFTIPMPEAGGAQVGVKLEAQVEALEARFEEHRSEWPGNNPGEPADVAWRQVKGLIEMKLEAVRNHQTTLYKEFLPDVVTPEGDTLGEAFLTRGAELLPQGAAGLLPGVQ